MSTWTSTSPRTFALIGGAWICTEDVQAVAQDGELVRIFLSSGSSIRVNPGEGRDAEDGERDAAPPTLGRQQFEGRGLSLGGAHRTPLLVDPPERTVIGGGGGRRRTAPASARAGIGVVHGHRTTVARSPCGYTRRTTTGVR